ncbi:hypothetical protein HAX54_031332 [Datura stramonium]|uniref:Uncharacterized protein n=1 Tax=Datura stramonium TaxID=4076 RepID=A0ABS8V920_DATST|nr:hypothetical protein [Datura stramonium]
MVKFGGVTSVCQEKRDCMLGFDAPFDPLRLKGALGRGRTERKAISEDKSDGSSGDGAGYSGPTGPFQKIEADLAVG